MKQEEKLVRLSLLLNHADTASKITRGIISIKHVGKKRIVTNEGDQLVVSEIGKVRTKFSETPSLLFYTIVSQVENESSARAELVRFTAAKIVEMESRLKKLGCLLTKVM